MPSDLMNNSGEEDIRFLQRVSTGAIIVWPGQKVLILRRSENEQMLGGYWELPGGRIRHGEIPRNAVVREVKEETGLDVIVQYLLCEFDYMYEEGSSSVHVVQLNYVTRPTQLSKVTLSPEHDAWRLIEEHECKNLTMSRKTRSVIETFFRMNNSKSD